MAGPVGSPDDRAQFDQLVFALVRLIPEGRVMTYGQIAGLIPTPRSIDPSAYRRIRARWVGYALARCPQDVPWHRVINFRGVPSQRASGGHLPQRAMLEAEGVMTTGDGRIDLQTCGWQPMAHDLAGLELGEAGP
jgi:methylated-DNA-protein-cysteine methyltransferase-like protein